MLNKIIRFSLRNRMLVLLVTAFLLVGGVYITANTDIDVFPDLNAPTVTVMTEAPGYAPEEVERTVTFPIETALNGATDVRRVRSTSTPGFSVVWVEFDWGTDIYRARQIVSEKISTIGSQLPDDVNSPVLGPQSSILGEMMIIGLTADNTSLLDLRTIADRNISPRLLALGGVSQVSVIGGDVKEYQILLNSEKMRYFNVSLQQVLEATEGVNSNAGGGILYEYGNEYTIKGNINTQNLDEIASSVVKSDASGVVLISDVAEVKVGAKTPKLGVGSEKGKAAVLLTVTKQPSTDTNELTNKIVECLNDVKTTLPADVNISTDTFRQSNFINSSIDNIKNSLIEGALFVVVVLFLFLMNTRTTVISVIALPLSVLVAIIILHYMGSTINTMTLGGLAIAIGSLVDDAIVDVENVYKRLRANSQLPEGERRRVIDVVFDASTEVRMPIFNSTLIIIASFLPLFFLSGMEGRMLIPLGVAFIVALIASTLVALTVTPVLCSYMLGKDNGGKANREALTTRKLKSLYSKGLTWAFARKKVVLGGTAALFLVAFGLFFTLGRSFLPSFNEGSFTINVSTLPGVSLEESDKIGREAERLLLEVPEVKTTARKTGRAELAEHSFGANVSEIEVPYELNGRSKSELAKEIREKLSTLPGTNIEMGQPISHRIDAMLSGSKAQIAIKVFGDDLSALYKVGQDVKQVISGVDGIVDANVEQQVDRPQLRITPRRAIMAKYGVTIAQFKDVINTALQGNVVSQVYSEGLPYDLTVRFSDSERNSIEALRNITIDTNAGKVPLSEVADIKSTDGPNGISRENVSRRILISANVDGRDLRGAVEDIKERINQNVKLPENYYIVYGGQFESEAKASKTLAIASVVSLLLVFMLLYHEFHNTTQSLIILLNLPLAMIGGVLVLVFTAGELNIPAIIGFISLLGISTRNGMLLISRYNHLQSEGVELMPRIVAGSIDRLSPIIMTALTSALALIPLAVKASQPGNEIQSPMAIVILGGLFSATLLNVFVVPIIYYITHKNKNEEVNQ
ncbi:MAG: efflux RND transporter permease subunit [Muribaculaceae bacterium]